MALAVPLPGVLAEAAVDDQERPLPLVLGDRLASLGIHLDIHEQGLLPPLAVARVRSVRGEPQVRDRRSAREILQLGLRGEPARQRDTVHVRHPIPPWRSLTLSAWLRRHGQIATTSNTGWTSPTSAIHAASPSGPTIRCCPRVAVIRWSR